MTDQLVLGRLCVAGAGFCRSGLLQQMQQACGRVVKSCCGVAYVSRHFGRGLQPPLVIYWRLDREAAAAAVLFGVKFRGRAGLYQGNPAVALLQPTRQQPGVVCDPWVCARAVLQYDARVHDAAMNNALHVGLVAGCSC
jgi:hypothetical protein